MPKVHKNTGDSSYTITYKEVGSEKIRVHEGWHSRNSADAMESFERKFPNRTIIKIERQMVSHLQ